jgi:choline dehydrogenase-like flavoprotein
MKSLVHLEPYLLLLQEPSKSIYGCIAISAGSAGCVVAKHLTEHSNTTVLLLKAVNTTDTKSEIHIPAERLSLLSFEIGWASTKKEK